MPKSTRGLYGANIRISQSGVTGLLLMSSAGVVNLCGLMFCLMALSSCAPSRKSCELNYGPCGEFIVRTDTETVYLPLRLPPVTVTDTIEIEKLLRDTTLLHVPFVVQDSGAYVQLIYWKDQYGRLFAKCSTTEKPRYAPCPQIPQPQKKPPPCNCPPEPTLAWWKWMLIGTGIGFVLAIIIKLALK